MTKGHPLTCSMNFIVFKCQCFKHLNTVVFSQMLLFAVN